MSSRDRRDQLRDELRKAEARMAEQVKLASKISDELSSNLKAASASLNTDSAAKKEEEFVAVARFAQKFWGVMAAVLVPALVVASYVIYTHVRMGADLQAVQEELRRVYEIVKPENVARLEKAADRLESTSQTLNAQADITIGGSIKALEDVLGGVTVSLVTESQKLILEEAATHVDEISKGLRHPEVAGPWPEFLLLLSETLRATSALYDISPVGDAESHLALQQRVARAHVVWCGSETGDKVCLRDRWIKVGEVVPARMPGRKNLSTRVLAMIDNLEGVIKLRQFQASNGSSKNYLDEALECFESAVKKDPGLVHAHSNISVCIGYRFNESRDLHASDFLGFRPAFSKLDAIARDAAAEHDVASCRLKMSRANDEMKKIYDSGLAKLEEAARRASKERIRDVRLLASGIIANNKANWHLEYARWLLLLKDSGCVEQKVIDGIAGQIDLARAEVVQAINCSSLIPVVHETAIEILCCEIDSNKAVFLSMPADHKKMLMRVVMEHVGSAVRHGHRPYAWVTGPEAIGGARGLTYFKSLEVVDPGYALSIWARIQLELAAPGR